MTNISEDRIVEEFCTVSVALGSTASAAYVGNQPKVHDLIRILQNAVLTALANIGVDESGVAEVQEAFRLGYQKGMEKQMTSEVQSDDARA